MRRLSLGLAALLSLGCGDGATAPPGAHILVSGRLERGAAIVLHLLDGADTVPSATVTWQVLPSGAATVSRDTLGAGAVVVPTSAGSLTILASANGYVIERVLQVSTPPSVVFALLTNGNRDVWRVALDGRDTARLTTDPADDRLPTAAAGRVVFVSTRNGASGLFAVGYRGGAVAPVITSPAFIDQPALNSTGTRVAFVFADTGAPKVWVANGNGTGARWLAPSLGFPGAIEGWPAWSPDGTHLALMSTATGLASLFVVDSAGTITDTLVDTMTAFQPAWSPDGTRLVFAGAPSGQNTSLFVVPIGGAAVQLTNRAGHDDSAPTWLPDGRIVYLASLTDSTAELRWLDPASPALSTTIPIPPGLPSSPRYLPPS